MPYEIPEGTPRSKCAGSSCPTIIAFVINPATRSVIPVNAVTGESHLATCMNPLNYRQRRRKRPDVQTSTTPAAASRYSQKEMPL